LELIWADWRSGLAIAAALATAAALLGTWLTPRGPITASEALVSMALALAVGAAAGLTTGSRWSILVAPAVSIVVFEVARLPIDGPTVDGIHLDSMYGVIAVVLGRGLHALLVVAPMAIGAYYGVELAARLGKDGTAKMGPLGWILAGILAFGLLALSVVIASPAITAPILGADGEPPPGSIAELTTARIGGHDQALMIRGRSTENPVLLYLNGGPGGTDIGAMRRDVGLEQDFVVVTWEQRGSGKSYSALDPAATLTLDQMVADTVELTTYLRDRFDEDKIYLVGNSWGATLGVLAAQQHPELYHAYVGIGQMVSQRETDILFYEDTLAWAERTGNQELAAALREIGPPPYADIRYYEEVIGHEHEWNPYPELDLDNEMPAILFVPENSLMDRLNAFRGFLDSFYVLYPQLQEIDFRRTATNLDLPVYMVLGEHEARGRAVPANEWFEMLAAPTRERIIFEGAGHRAHFDRPADFAALMARVVDETYLRADAGSAGVVPHVGLP
jgi:pimeloyl-ACP methyl ester carboxylesterase